MSAASQWIVCGWAFIVASFAINGDMDASATLAAIAAVSCVATSLVLNFTDLLEKNNRKVKR